jgi:hypothetical protein
MHVEGTILAGPEFDPIEGRVVVEDGEIVAVEEGPTDSDDVVVPAFVNAHTHIGDSIAKEAGGGLSLDELVAPPDGLKHQLLRAASREEKVTAMARSLRFMESTGTAAFLEFREGGVEGVAALRDALAGEDTELGARDIESVILGREETDVLEVADGFGASGARDADFDAERTATPISMIEILLGKPVTARILTTPLTATRIMAIGARMTAPRRKPWTVFQNWFTNSLPGDSPVESAARMTGRPTPKATMVMMVHIADVITVY